jgi:hypothetical protein
MPTRDEYRTHARTVVLELFPNLSEDATTALVWLIADFLLSLDAMTAPQ